MKYFVSFKLKSLKSNSFRKNITLSKRHGQKRKITVMYIAFSLFIQKLNQSHVIYDVNIGHKGRSSFRTLISKHYVFISGESHKVTIKIFGRLGVMLQKLHKGVENTLPPVYVVLIGLGPLAIHEEVY